MDEDVQNQSTLSIIHYQTLPLNPTPANEVDDLKFRISQLEHLVISSSFSNTTISSTSHPNSTRLTNHGLIERVSQLESLLAASELDNQHLNREIDVLNASRHELKVNFLEQLREKDLIISDLEQNIELLQVKVSKGEQRLETVGEYVNTLPSQEELDEAKECLSRYETETNLLQDKVDRLTYELNETSRKFVEKETLHNSTLLRLEELKPFEEAQNAFVLDNSQVADGNTPDLELLTEQKAQIIRCGKIITTLRTKLCECEAERAEFLLQISEKTTQLVSIEENLVVTQVQMETLQKLLSQSDGKRKAFEATCIKLQTRLDEDEKLFQLRGQEMGNLIRLVTEIDVAVQEINILVVFAQNVASGDEPPVDSVLGLSELDVDLQIEESMRICRSRTKTEEIESYVGTSENMKSSDFDSIQLDLDSEFDVDIEWILERLKQVRDLRKGICDLRTHVSDLYSDVMSGSAQGCGIQ